MGEALSKGAVIGQEEEAFAVFIQTSDREEPTEVSREQRNDGWAVGGIGAGGENARGFVQSQTDGHSLSNRATSNGHTIVWPDLRGEFGEDFSIDGHDAGTDQLIAGPPGATARRR
jgi:hypothetical protein